MESPESVKEFFIWGIDDCPYGPVKLAVLAHLPQLGKTRL